MEITAGLSKAARGIVLGSALSSFLVTLPDVAVQLETGEVRPLRPDHLRRLDGGAP